MVKLRFGLRPKLLLSIMVPLIALTLPPLWIVNQSVERQVNANVREDLSRAGAVFELLLAERSKQLAVAGDVVVRDPKFFSTLTVPHEGHDEEFRATLQGVARDFNASARQEIFEVLDEKGNWLASATSDKCDGVWPAPFMAPVLTGQAVQGVTLRLGLPHLVSITPVMVGGRMVGALVLGQHLGNVLAQQLRFLTRSEVTFLAGNIPSGSTLEGTPEEVQSLVFLTSPGGLHTLEQSRGRVMALHAAQQHYLTLARPFPGSRPSDHIYYVLQRSVEEETAFLRLLQEHLIQLGIVAALAAILAGLLISRGITRPIYQLVRSASEMERGNYEYPIDVRSRDEVGYLARRFQDMRQHMREHVSKLKEAARVKTEFLSVASHELRTPITIIKGFQELLGMKILGALTPQQQEAVDAIGKSCETLSRIAEDATRMAQIDQEGLVLERQELDLAELVGTVVRSVRQAAPDRVVEISWDVEDSLDSALLDGPRMAQALVNLVENAVRFTPDGGSVQVLARREGDQLRIDVCDSGVGIEPARLHELFEQPHALRDSLTHHSSHTLEFNSAGLGLGLPIARGIVDAHGGTLEVRSEVNRGSTFSVLLPCPDQALKEAA